MNIIGTQRIMETTSPETANHYLRFGWKLINQYTVPATEDTPERVTYIMAAVSGLEDTRRILILSDGEEANDYLEIGWRLIEKFITSDQSVSHRQEKLHLVLAWQRDEVPALPGQTVRRQTEHVTEFSGEDEIPVDPAS